LNLNNDLTHYISYQYILKQEQFFRTLFVVLIKVYLRIDTIITIFTLSESLTG